MRSCSSGAVLNKNLNITNNIRMCVHVNFNLYEVSLPPDCSDPRSEGPAFLPSSLLSFFWNNSQHLPGQFGVC